MSPRCKLACLLVTMALPAQAGACDDTAHRAFDFWIGDWQVHTAAGKFAGENRISKAQGGCVLHEQYATPSGYQGQSLNIYDASRQLWHQTWVDNGGLLLMLEGKAGKDSMQLSGHTLSASGQTTRHRISWTARPDGSVRQHWESADATGNWITAFDGIYTRKSAKP